jgi:hypothetical protein
VCMKHEHKEHHVITWCEVVECRDKDKEITKSNAEVLEVKPNAVDQSKSKEIKKFMSCHSELTISSNVRRLRSHHNVHIRHKGTKFQMSEENFPKLFCQPINNSRTHSERTHSSSNVFCVYFLL